MILNLPLKDQQLMLENTMDLDVPLQQNQSQETIGQKCIDYLGKPRAQGEKQKKGWQGEVIAFNKLARFGYDVRFEKPCNYDLTIHGEKGISRVQVKCFYKHKKGLRVSLKRSNVKNGVDFHYALTDFDFLAAVNLDNEEVYFVSIFEIESSRNLGLVPLTIKFDKIKSYKI